MLILLLSLSLNCQDTAATFDVRPFVSTAIDDFLTRKDADESDVFGTLNYK